MAINGFIKIDMHCMNTMQTPDVRHNSSVRCAYAILESGMVKWRACDRLNSHIGSGSVDQPKN